MKRKLIISVLVSLDGYIADENGNVFVLERFYRDRLPAGSSDRRVPLEFDTVLVGKKTYHCYYQSLLNMKQKKVIVLTHEKLDELPAHISTYTGDISELLQRLRQHEGKQIWLFGGATLIDQAVQHNLVDQINLITLPLELKTGIALFNTKHPAPKVRLQSLETKDEMSYSIWNKIHGGDEDG